MTMIANTIQTLSLGLMRLSKNAKRPSNPLVR